MASSPDYAMWETTEMSFADCGKTIADNDAEQGKKAAEAALLQKEIDIDNASIEAQVFVPTRTQLAADDVLGAAHTCAHSRVAKKASYTWDEDAVRSRFAQAELKPKVEAFLSALPTSHRYADALALLEDYRTACTKCDAFAPDAIKATTLAWADFRANHAAALAKNGTHGLAWLEWAFIAASGRADAAAAAAKQRQLFYASHLTWLQVKGGPGASAEAARLVTANLKKVGRTEVLVIGDEKSPIAVDIVLGSPTCARSEQASSNTASVNRGRKTVKNEDYADAQSDVKNGERHVEHDEREVARHSAKAQERDSRTLAGSQKDLQRAQERLAGMSPTKEVEDIVDESYPTTVVRNVCTVPVEIRTRVPSGDVQLTKVKADATSEDFNAAQSRRYPDGTNAGLGAVGAGLSATGAAGAEFSALRPGGQFCLSQLSATGAARPPAGREDLLPLILEIFELEVGDVFSEWNRIFKDPMTTTAAIDRVVHHSVVLEFDVESYRTEAAKKAAKNKEATRARAMTTSARRSSASSTSPLEGLFQMGPGREATSISASRGAAAPAPARPRQRR